MNILFNFRRRTRTREEALTWLARLKRGLRAGEGPELLDWLERPVHRTAIAKAAIEWDGGPEILALLSQLFPIDPQLLKPRKRNPATVSLGVLVGVCVAVTPIVIANHTMPGVLFPRLSADGLLESGDIYTTAVGATRRLALEDGTGVMMNGGSRMAVAYSEHLRAIMVSHGEVTFTVAQEPHRPFHVHAAGRDFEAKTGTFNVRVSAPSRLDLTVLKGTVIVFPAQARAAPGAAGARSYASAVIEPIGLGPLEALESEPYSQSGRKISADEARTLLAWQHGITPSSSR
jgi:transmembrane sensor